jgi:hypothetical protein
MRPERTSEVWLRKGDEDEDEDGVFKEASCYVGMYMIYNRAARSRATCDCWERKHSNHQERRRSAMSD